MASSIAVMTMPRSIAFSRATASAICNSSSLLALTAIAHSPPLAAGLCGRCRDCLSSRLARFALGGFLSSQSLGHQSVGEHQLGFTHVLNRNENLGFFALGRVVAADARALALS